MVYETFLEKTAKFILEKKVLNWKDKKIKWGKFKL